MDLTFIKDEEIRKQVQAVIESVIKEETDGLVAKNHELLGKLKKAQKDSTIDPDEHRIVQEENDRLKTENSDLKKANKTAMTEVEKHKKLYETEAGVTHKLIVQNGLTSALVEAKVKPEYMDAVIALLSPQTVLKAEGDTRVAMVGDKPLTDYVNEWVKSDKGKHYVAAPNNQGGGAHGGAGEAHAEGLEKIANPAARLTAINLAAKK